VDDRRRELGDGGRHHRRLLQTRRTSWTAWTAVRGVTAIIAAGFLFVAVHLAMVGGGINTNWDALRVILGLALLGAVLGFVPYNFNPASIFMGDTGSMLLGYACGTMIILLAQQQAKWGLAAMVIFALPILDTMLAFARRYLKGRPIFEADRGHFHHQLVARGFTVKQTVLISYGLSIFFALLGVSMVFMRTRYTVAIYMITFAYVIVAAYKMGMVHERPRVVRRQELGTSSAGEATPHIEAATVLEIREDQRRTPAAETAGAPGTGGAGRGRGRQRGRSFRAASCLGRGPPVGEHRRRHDRSRPAGVIRSASSRAHACLANPRRCRPGTPHLPTPSPRRAAKIRFPVQVSAPPGR
jgi:hypothetical protein